MKKQISFSLIMAIISGLILSSFAGVCLGEEPSDTINLTTYYPAPYGVYGKLRLFPIADLNVAEGLSCDREGTIRYDVNNHQLLYCYSDGFSLLWKLVAGEEAENYWGFDSNTNVFHTLDSGVAEDYWYVGIGTKTPADKFHVDDGIVLFEGDIGATPAFTYGEEGGTRLMWIPEKAAFRIGRVSSSDIDVISPWNNEHIGYGSFAAGKNVLANEDGSVAMGIGLGDWGDPLWPSGARAHGATAIGYGVGASALASTAIGYRTMATGQYSTAIGRGPANEGDPLFASGKYSTAIAYVNDEDPHGALGYASLSLGYSTLAEGDYSIAIGRRARAIADRSAVISVEDTDYPGHCETDVEGQLKICGSLKVTGTVTAGQPNAASPYGTITAQNCEGTCKAFRIPHPDPNKPEGTYLIHRNVETPTAGDNLYRWEIETKNKTAVVELPAYYKYLNKDSMVLAFPKKHFGMAYGKVDDKQEALTIYADTDGTYNVMLIGTRKDEAAAKYWQGPEVYIEPAG